MPDILDLQKAISELDVDSQKVINVILAAIKPTQDDLHTIAEAIRGGVTISLTPNQK